MFRAGEQGRYWYAVLGGQLEVRYHAADTKDGKVGIAVPMSINTAAKYLRPALNLVPDLQIQRMPWH